MTVYVDNMRAPYGQMKMCHMIAESTDELLAMADRIGVDRKWLQKPGTRFEHFDIALSKRRLAVQAGAVEVGQMELGRILRRIHGPMCKNTQQTGISANETSESSEL